MPRFCQVGRGHRTFSGVWRTAVCNQIAALEILVHPFKADATVATMADEMPMSIPPIHKVVEPVPSSSRSPTTTTVPRSRSGATWMDPDFVPITPQTWELGAHYPVIGLVMNAACNCEAVNLK